MTAYRLQYYFRNRYMSEFDMATCSFMALSDEEAVKKSIRKMKKRAGSGGQFKSNYLRKR